MSDQSARIGYFVPEFPSQTHVFFWRELRVLRQLGLDPQIISTRQPRSDLGPHAWTQEAVSQTSYLFPPTIGALCGAVWELLRSGPRGWCRCLDAVRRAEGVSRSQRLRLLALIIPGAQLAWLARRGGWSHVHSHFCGDAANVALFAHFLAGLTYSLSLHAPLRDFGPNQPQKWRHAAFGIVITQRLLKELHEQLNGSIPPILEVAPMGVEMDRFTRSTIYRPWEGSGPSIIFSCGRLHPAKGHHHLVRAVWLLRQRGVDAKLRIAGEDMHKGYPYRHALKSLIQELSLQEHVTLLGAVSEETIISELEHAHVFALASRSEPLGVVTMEAMAMSVPVVATNAGGVPELIHDGVQGLLVPPEDPEGLAAAIHQILQYPDLAVLLSHSGRTRIAKSFHSGISAQVLVRCLRQMDRQRDNSQHQRRAPASIS